VSQSVNQIKLLTVSRRSYSVSVSAMWPVLLTRVRLLFTRARLTLPKERRICDTILSKVNMTGRCPLALPPRSVPSVPVVSPRFLLVLVLLPLLSPVLLLMLLLLLLMPVLVIAEALPAVIARFFFFFCELEEACTSCRFCVRM
jgi:hypothetical protein